ncbi:MAG: hypothetical protein V3U62_03270 [Sedimenticolaceae bacterium]
MDDELESSGSRRKLPAIAKIFNAELENFSHQTPVRELIRGSLGSNLYLITC